MPRRYALHHALRPALIAPLAAAGLFAGVVALLHADDAANVPASVPANLTVLPSLEERVTKLEKLANQPPLPQDPTVVAHAAATQPAAASVSFKTPEEARQAYLQMNARQDALERRLTVLENKSRLPGPTDDAAKQLADLRRLVEDQRRDAKDLETRLHRVEVHTGL